MAGYMTKLQGYVYEGTYKAAEALTNGVFVEITADGVKKIAAKGDAVLRVDAKEMLFGKKALRLSVVHAGTADTFFTENEWDHAMCCEWNLADYEIAIGDYVKMHRLVPGDQLIMSVDDTVYAAVAVGDTVNPNAGGSVVKTA